MRMTPRLLMRFVHLEMAADDPDRTQVAWRSTRPAVGDVLELVGPDHWRVVVVRVRDDTAQGDGVARATALVRYVRDDPPRYRGVKPW